MLSFVILTLVVSTFGAPGISFQGRIVGGKATTIEEYPYQVSVQFYGVLICGGSIISPKHVITAAHCTYQQPASALTVRVGSNTTTQDGQEIPVERIHENPNFNITTMDYDISVLYLYNSIKFGPAAKPIKLAPHNFILKNNQSVVLTGWGTIEQGGDLPTSLQVVKVPSISNEACQNAYRNFMEITTRMLCAQENGGGKDSCQGDSGGPMVAEGYLVGIVSWGLGCGLPDFPGVYTRVSELLDFIKNVTTL